MCSCPQDAGTPDCEVRVAPKQVPCPTNHQTGKAIDPLALKAQLAVPLTQMTATNYRFCPDPDCPTVYYSTDGSQLFDEANLRERVYQKHPYEDDAFVCYCFRHTIGSIRAELLATDASTVIESITAGIQAEKCACDIRNPQGNCCLGNVRAVVQRLQEEMGLKQTT